MGLELMSIDKNRKLPIAQSTSHLSPTQQDKIFAAAKVDDPTDKARPDVQTQSL